MPLSPPLFDVVEKIKVHFPVGQVTDAFDVALTRRAYNTENHIPGAPDHESMEWLGDRILGAVVAQELWSRFPHAKPGRLDLVRDMLTSEGPLAEIAKELQLLSAIRMGIGEEKQGQVRSKKALSDHVEALVAAAFLCGGWAAATAFVGLILGDRYPQELPESEARGVSDEGSQAMTALNTRVQARWKTSVPLADWDVQQVGGVGNSPVHQATVRLPDGEVLQGEPVEGRKQTAKASAARVALAYLDTLGPV